MPQIRAVQSIGVEKDGHGLVERDAVFRRVGLGLPRVTGSYSIVEARSSEPDTGFGDGDLPGDIVGFVLDTQAPSVALNGALTAERSGSGTGRTYTLDGEFR